MREILFRGKRVDNGEWVYGNLVKHNNGCLDFERYDIFTGHSGWGFEPSLSFERYEIMEHTVGQFTGLTDKNGTKIFEGDIVDIHQTVNGCNLFEIVWDKCKWNARYYVQMITPRLYEYNFEELMDVNEQDKEIEVIGNIHEKGK